MKKEGLLELLNKAPDSISLHDATICRFSWVNNSITFIIVIGGYHYMVNHLEQFINDMENDVVLSLRFDGISQFKCDIEADCRFEGSEIMENNEEEGFFEMQILGGSYFDLRFKYESFAWDVIGEFDDDALQRWYEENGIPKDEE